MCDLYFLLSQQISSISTGRAVISQFRQANQLGQSVAVELRSVGIGDHAASAGKEFVVGIGFGMPSRLAIGVDELLENGTLDGGFWDQPFYYYDLAHIIIQKKSTFIKDPARRDREFEWNQDIVGLSKILEQSGIDHSIGDFALDVKLY